MCYICPVTTKTLSNRTIKHDRKIKSGEFAVDNNYEEKMRTRDRLILERISKKKVVRNTLITTYGLKRNPYSGIFTNVLTLEDLFI
ncbi:hypothetical protein SAMN02910263_01243 [Butyrivibrio sp. INlla16]|nr:hypothetical protein SAMN02910263_01243 [Butyrivibrio sp. INlla16]